MSTNELDQLTPTLLALDAAEVKAPSGMPIATILAEAETLERLVARAPVAAKLAAVGLDAELIADFPVIVRAARQAQTFWTQVRSRKKSTVHENSEARGQALRSEMLQACSWNLRKDREAQQTLQYVREGDGTADLAQDLHDLAGLIENNPTAFAKDDTFDAATVAAEARQVADQLMGETADYHHRFPNSQAKNVRDRAFTHLSTVVEEVREAGRYAYRGDQDMITRFASGYWRSYNRGRRRDNEPQVPDAPAAEPSDTDKEPAPAEE